MRRLLSILFILPTLVFSMLQEAEAQLIQPEYKTGPSTVAVLARSKGDSVMLRWAPDNPILWKAGNQYGYRIIRTLVVRNDSILPVEKRVRIIIADTIKPFSLGEIEPLIEKDNYAAIVGQAIYGQDFQITASFEKDPAGLLNKARELEDRYSFALFSADRSPLAARVHGLWYTDKKVRPGEKFVYSIIPLVPSDKFVFDTAHIFVDVRDTVPLPKPYNPKAKFGDKYVELSWNREYHQQFYTSYLVERSDDNGYTFRPTTHSPFINLSENPEVNTEYIYRVDSLPENNRTYFYRVKGISPFGETGPPSDTVFGMGYSKEDFLNPIIIRNQVIGSAAYIEWEIPEQLSSSVKGFEISKSHKSDGPFFPIIPDTLNSRCRSFTDPAPFKSCFYRVASIDKRGEKHYSFPAMVLMPDSLPPQMPSNFIGMVDSTGIVTLSWQSNSDDDLAGYRIYRSNYANDGYVKLNNEIITRNKFYDTLSLGVLDKEVFYKVAAIDNHYNESTQTPALIISRPDTILPAPPSFKKYEVNDSSITIRWTNSPSKDVEDHVLLRTEAGKSNWQRINQKGDTSEIYSDNNVVDRQIYQYRIIAVDKNGLESEVSGELSIRASGINNRTDNVVLKGRKDNDGKSITLNWTGNSSTVSKFFVYRSKDDGALVLFRTFVSGENSFSDTDVAPGHTYSYRIQCLNITGIRSALSGALVIDL